MLCFVYSGCIFLRSDLRWCLVRLIPHPTSPVWFLVAFKVVICRRSMDYGITTVSLCPGTFDSVFRGFLSPLLESLAPKMPSLTPATR